MSPDGKLTAEMAGHISEYLKGGDCEVFFDHGSALKEMPLGVSVGNIVSWYGDKRGSQLSHLDIAIVEKSSRKRAFALIEIEEKDDRPKNFLGDMLAILIGGRITFRGERLKIGDWTTLIVLGKRTFEQESKSAHKNRIEYLYRKIESIKETLQTNNSKIGKVMLGTFTDGSDLRRILLEQFAHLKKGE
jgi:hypothetical protein